MERLRIEKHKPNQSVSCEWKSISAPLCTSIYTQNGMQHIALVFDYPVLILTDRTTIKLFHKFSIEFVLSFYSLHLTSVPNEINCRTECLKFRNQYFSFWFYTLNYSKLIEYFMENAWIGSVLLSSLKNKCSIDFDSLFYLPWCNS